MEILIQYWDLILALLALLVFAVFLVIKFIKNPKSTQMKKIKEWLVWACVEAEKSLQTGTGQIKLRYVYDLFIIRFKWMSRIISFETFSSMVDVALVEVRKMLETNDKVKQYVSHKE